MRDEKKPDGTYVRIVDCIYCGRYEFPLDHLALDKELLRKLNKQGFETGTREEELADVREKAMKRLKSKDRMQTSSADLEFQSIMEEAISSKADSVEMEFVREGLEITYTFGPSGFGRVLSDKKLGSEIVKMIVEHAKLQNKQSGQMDWVYGGETYKIKVEEYENFGESAFRLIPIYKRQNVSGHKQ